MITRVYSVFDRKALIYMSPFFANTDGLATRMIADAANDQNTSLAKHPEDFVLYCIGSYDDQKGFIAGIDPLIHVVDVLALLKV